MSGTDTWEPRAGQPHPADEAFYKLTVKERDYERVCNERLDAENHDLRAENTRLREALERIADRLTAADGVSIAQGTAAAMTARVLAEHALPDPSPEDTP